MSSPKNTPTSTSTGHPASQFHPDSQMRTAQPNPNPYLGSNHLAAPTPASATEHSPNRASGSGSPAQPGQGHLVKRSRQRPTKSCERCRAKKLKCDRELPCGNCKKGGRDGRDCEFRFGNEDEGPKVKRVRTGAERGDGQWFESGNGSPLVVAGSTMGNGVGLGGRVIEGYEQMPCPKQSWQGYVSSVGMPAWGSAQHVRPSVSQTTSNTASPLGRIELKGTRSRYVGAGDKMAMFDHFEHSKCFVMKSFKDPQTTSMMQEMSTFQKHYSPNHKCKPEIRLPYNLDELTAEMLKALPSGFLFGTLQARYVSNWETVLRILHIPKFMRECDALQEARQAEPLTALPSHIPIWVVPQILSVISISSRLRDPSERSPSGEEIPDEMITKNMLMVQRWLDELHGKITLNLPILQTRALLLLARQANLSHPAELCRRAGDLVRVAMIMGLHRDPEDCEQMSKSQKEMRRKLWITIVELDMQFSLAAGMPASVTSSSFMLQDLVNVDDQELEEEMQNYPPSKGDTVWTNSMPQIALATSLRDRLIAINALGGCLDLGRDAPTLLSHAKVLEQALHSLPDQFRGSTRAGNSNNKRMYRLFTSIMLDISIRGPLLALYRTVSTSSVSSRYPEARRGALRSSLAILSHLDALDPAVADLNTVKSRDYLNLFHILCKNDIMQSALIICYEIRSFNSSPSSSATTNDGEQFADEPFPQTKHSLTRVVENTLNSILQRLGEFGSDLKDVFPLAVVLQSVRSDGSPEEIRESMIRGAERVLKACRKVMPSIEDAALLNNVARGNDAIQQQAAPILLPLQNWNTGMESNMDQPYAGYGGTQIFDDFNMVPSDLNFADFDLGFGFTDWDMNHYWV